MTKYNIRLADKSFISLPPRCGKTVTMEMLEEINNRKGSVSLDILPENISVTPETIKKLLMPATKLTCPECGSILFFDHETECEVILYCMHCDKKVKAKKG